MKYNSKYRVAKDSVDWWVSKEHPFYTDSFTFLKEHIKRDKSAKIFKLFLKRLRKTDKTLWHKFVD